MRAPSGTVYDDRMSEKKKAKRYPSRDKVKYVPIPIEMWEELDSLGKPDERSVSYMTRKAIRELIERAKESPADTD